MLYSSHSLYTVRLYTQISPPVHLSYFVILELVPGHVTSDLKPRDSLIAFTNCWNFWWNLLKIVIVTIAKSHINQKALEGILSLRMKNLVAPLVFPVRLTSTLLLDDYIFWKLPFRPDLTYFARVKSLFLQFQPKMTISPNNQNRQFFIHLNRVVIQAHQLQLLTLFKRGQ